MNDEYIKRSEAVCVANYAADVHPYERDKPVTRTAYNEGWCDACDYIESHLETLPAAPVRPVVLCRECIYRGSPDCSIGFIYDKNDGCAYLLRDDDFCSRGERADMRPGEEERHGTD